MLGLGLRLVDQDLFDLGLINQGAGVCDANLTVVKWAADHDLHNLVFWEGTSTDLAVTYCSPRTSNLRLTIREPRVFEIVHKQIRRTNTWTPKQTAPLRNPDDHLSSVARALGLSHDFTGRIRHGCIVATFGFSKIGLVVRPSPNKAYVLTEEDQVPLSDVWKPALLGAQSNVEIVESLARRMASEITG